MFKALLDDGELSPVQVDRHGLEVQVLALEGDLVDIRLDFGLVYLFGIGELTRVDCGGHQVLDLFGFGQELVLYMGEPFV